MELGESEEGRERERNKERDGERRQGGKGVCSLATGPHLRSVILCRMTSRLALTHSLARSCPSPSRSSS